MDIIKPLYDTGVILGFYIKQEDFNIKMLARLTSLSEEKIIEEIHNYSDCSDVSEFKDWLNLNDELMYEVDNDIDMPISIIYPDQYDQDNYIIGVFKDFECLNDLTDIFDENDISNIQAFQNEFNLDLDINQIISIGTED